MQFRGQKVMLSVLEGRDVSMKRPERSPIASDVYSNVTDVLSKRPYLLVLC